MKHAYLLPLLICLSCVQSKDSSVTKGRVTTTYKSYFACKNESSPPSSQAELVTFSSAGTFVTEVLYYDQLDCQVADAFERNYYYGTYSYDSALSKMTLKFKKLEIAFLTQDEVDIQNDNGQCGYNDWGIGVLKDVTDNDDCTEGTVYSHIDPVVINATLTEEQYIYDSLVLTRVNL